MEARLQDTDGGLVPSGDGWFVVNARDARWLTGDFGAFAPFEGEQRFPSVGVNVAVLEPGQPSCYYHAEQEQEDFIVIAGECLLLIADEERRLRAWDFVHCPAGTEHVFVGAGDGPCVVIGIGSRTGGAVVYPESELAQRHGAGVRTHTDSPAQAYSGVVEDVPTPYREGWLPWR